MCGGVVVIGDNPVMATDWSSAAERHPDAYVRDLAHQVQRAMSTAAVMAEANRRLGVELADNQRRRVDAGHPVGEG